MKQITISITDEAYLMVEQHLSTLRKLNEAGTEFVPDEKTVEEWAEEAFKLAVQPIYNTSDLPSIAAIRKQAEAARVAILDNLIFDQTARAARGSAR